jgi:C-terminal binding protein
MSSMPRVAIIDSTENTYIHSPDVESSVLADCTEIALLRVPSEEALATVWLEDLVGVISWHSIPLGRATLRRLSRCKVVVRAAVGFDNIDTAEAARLALPVCNVPDYGTEEVADHTMAMLLALTRRLVPVDAAAKRGCWDWRLAGTLRRLRGATLGIVGFGRIGSAVARRALSFGINVLFFDPYVPSGTEKAHGVGRVRTLAELIDRADVISIHVPLTDETRHMFGVDQFSRMGSEKILLNTARGEVIEQKSLLAALREGRLRAAGLDVLESEPHVPRELTEHEDLLLTSHSAFFSTAGLLELREKAAVIMRDALVSGVLQNSVNGIIVPR